MKTKSRLTSIALLLALSGNALAECDFSTGIEKMPDGRYSYTKECHQKVGKLAADLKDREEQVVQLTKTIELKDLAIRTQEQRADLWMNTSMKLEDRVNQMEAVKSSSQWWSFAIGVGTTALAVWGAGQLRPR